MGILMKNSIKVIYTSYTNEKTPGYINPFATGNTLLCGYIHTLQLHHYIIPMEKLFFTTELSEHFEEMLPR